MERRVALFVAISLSIVLVDQATKLWIVSALTTRLDGAKTFGEQLAAMYRAPPAGDDGLHFQPKRSIVLSEGFLKIEYAENPGAAFGLFRKMPESIRTPLFHLVSLGAVVAISVYFFRLKGGPEENWAFYGFPIVMGGALGNYVDRLARGFVVDYIEAHVRDRFIWPSFNVADSAICIGLAMLVIDSLVRKELKPAVSSS